MAEDPVTIVKGGTLAQNIIGSAPEGMLIAPSWKRVLAFMLDVMLISIVLSFFTGGQLMANLFNIEMMTEGGRYSAAFVMNWFVFAAAFYLYSSTLAKRWVGPWLNEVFESPSFTTTVRCSRATTGVHGPWQKWSTSYPCSVRCGLDCATPSAPAPRTPNIAPLLTESITPLRPWTGRCLRRHACDCADVRPLEQAIEVEPLLSRDR